MSVLQQMNRSLLSLIEEVANKHTSSRPKYEDFEDNNVNPKIFKCRISLTFFKNLLCGEGESVKKKSSQHLAAGKLLLQIANHENGFQYFQNIAKSVENVCAIIQEEMGRYEKDNPGSVNSVVALQAYCKKCAMMDPIFEEIPTETNSFKIKCQVADRFETYGEGQSKKVAKSNAAESMIKKLEEIIVLSEQKNDEFKQDSNFIDKQTMETNNSVEHQQSINISMTSEDKENALKALNKTLRSSSLNQCHRDAMNKFKNLFQVYYGRPFEWKWISHETRKMTIVLESLHAIDMKRCKSLENIDGSMIIYSYFGTGDDENNAKNECCKQALQNLVYWLNRVKTTTAPRVFQSEVLETNSETPIQNNTIISSKA